jgi:hypothetical protein
MTGGMTFEVDRASGLFHVTSKGLCTPERVRAHFEEIGRAFRVARAAQRGVFVLVDLREASIQTAETAAEIGRGTDSVHSQADYVAFVCASKLHAMQVKRGVQMPTMAVFDDLDLALDWIATRRSAVA